MHERRGLGWGAVLAGILLVVIGAAAVGFLAYNAGVDAGTLRGADLPAADALPAYPFYHYGLRPFGAGFGLFGCLVPFLILMLIFSGLRLIFAPWRMRHWGWGPRWRGPGRERWREHIREEAEKWHKEMHEAQDEPGKQAEA